MLAALALALWATICFFAAIFAGLAIFALMVFELCLIDRGFREMVWEMLMGKPKAGP